MIDATNPWGNGNLLPAGTLREPLAALSRADCFVITRADIAIQTAALRDELIELKGLYYAMWRQQIGERSFRGSPAASGARVTV